MYLLGCVKDKLDPLTDGFAQGAPYYIFGSPWGWWVGLEFGACGKGCGTTWQRLVVGAWAQRTCRTLGCRITLRFGLEPAPRFHDGADDLRTDWG